MTNQAPDLLKKHLEEARQQLESERDLLEMKQGRKVDLEESLRSVEERIAESQELVASLEGLIESYEALLPEDAHEEEPEPDPEPEEEEEEPEPDPEPEPDDGITRCAICRGRYVKKKSNQKYCDENCKAEGARRRERERYNAENPIGPRGPNENPYGDLVDRIRDAVRSWSGWTDANQLAEYLQEPDVKPVSERLCYLHGRGEIARRPRPNGPTGANMSVYEYCHPDKLTGAARAAWDKSQGERS